ncbi:uncharacterized protein [Dysidea avara]|uniref:uncharacterized protein isoform X2 n=1 Tax=Dysidea avara TaxID=196820 RepID=UPI00331B8EBB
MDGVILRSFFIIIFSLCHVPYSNEQVCTDVVNIQQDGNNSLARNRYAIFPRLNFTCDGRLTNIKARVTSRSGSGNRVLCFQVWQPLSSESLMYNKIADIQLQGVTAGSNSFLETNISLNGDDRIEFQSGDVIGYYHQPGSQYQVKDIQTIGYMMYQFDGPPSTSVDLSEADAMLPNRQPLIQFTIGIRCNDLSTPPNGEIRSCSSGRVGVGYKGDTCSFTCDTGYEVIDSDTRTCQSDGSWSGSETMCRKVQCPPPTNGTLQCPNGATTGVFEDTCTFSCNGGYELQGSNSGTCLADQSWSGGDPICAVLNCSTSPPLDNSQLQLPCDTKYQSTCTTVCVDGYTGGGSLTCVLTDVGTNSVGWRGSTSCQRVQCPELLMPTNGMISSCSLISSPLYFYEDMCNFTCNTGYNLTGSPQRTCQSDGSWSGSPESCTIMECPSSSLPMNSMLAESCSSTYQSMCDLQCEEGFNGSGDPSYVCDVLSDGSSVMWMTSGEEGWSCERVQCTILPSPSNGNISCNSTGVPRYEDQCSFSCDPGYELTGSSTRQCLSNESWSGADVTCDILHCSNLTDIVDDNALVKDCSDEFGSVCSLGCITGYMVVGNNMFTCDIVNDGVEWRNNIAQGSFQCDIVTCTEDLVTPSNGSINCSSDNQTLQYQDTCTFQCDDGYEVEGSVMRQCGASGEWSGTSTQCNILHCPVTVVANSRPCDDTSYTSTCIVECEDGYNRSEDSSQYSCGLNGTGVTWMFTGSGVTCSPVQCTTLPSPSNGNISCNSTGIPRYEDQCSFSCDPGYELTGSSTRQCLSNESWSGADVTCDILHCSNLTDIVDDNALVKDCSDEFGSVCSLGCITGYMVVGNNMFTCDSANDGVEWRNNVTGGDFHCDIVTCAEDLVAPSNGSINCSSDNQPLQYQDTCTFQCDDGYEVEGSVMRQCEASGEWNGTSTQCNILHCPVTVVANSRPCDDTSYTSTCMVECEDGYNRSGDSSQYSCGLNSTGVTWMFTGSGVTCSPGLSVGSESDSESSHGSAGGIIGGAVAGSVVFVLLVVLLLIGLYFVKRRYTNKTYYPIHLYVNDDADSIQGSKTNLTSSYALYESVKLPNENHYEMDTSMDGQWQYSTVTSPRKCSYVDLERMKGIYEFDTSANISPTELAESFEEEQKIYETPYEDEADYGPIYMEPPNKVEKIYESINGQKIHKLHRENVRTLERLGSGEFGVVARGLLNDGVQVAVKTINTDVNDKDKLRFLQEAAIMCQFDHENVIKLYGVVTEAPVMIVLEYMSRGDLRSLLLDLQPSSGEDVPTKLPQLLLKTCQEIAAGMTYLAGKHFIHRDLAARNVLVSEDFTCKIADFGMSHDLATNNYYVTSGGKIPVKWTAPEALNYRKYSICSDVWSYGCVLFEIWSLGCKPFEKLDNLETLAKIDSGYRLPPPPGCPRTMYRIMIKCWHPDPRSRPQFGQITKLLAGNVNYLLGWSEEDIQVAGEDGMKLGVPMECVKNLYYDLQSSYNPM